MRVILAALVVVALVVPDAVGQQEQIEPVTKTKTVKHYPDRYKRRNVRFTPWERPSVAQVHKIIKHESRRWGNSAAQLSGRIACESGYRWDAGNGQYNGLGQFAHSTMLRGLSTMPKKVVFKRSRVIKRRIRVVSHYSDGARRAKWGKRVRVRRTRVYRGSIRPSYLHGWAQVRIMAQALVGRSAVNDSEWECRG